MTVLLVATDEGVAAHADDGSTRTELEGHAVTRLAADVHGCWAIGERHVLWQREPGGAWREVTRLDGPRLTCVLPRPHGVLAGTSEARLLAVLDGAAAPVTGFDDVDGRGDWHAVGSRVPYVRSITATAGAQVLLASVHVGGIPRSANGGSTWKPTIDPDADVHEVRAHPVDPNLVVAAAAVGLCLSHDAGEHWDVTTDGLHASYSRAVAFVREAALVSASDGPRAERGALYRWPVAGGPLERCRGGLPEWLEGNVDTGRLDAARDVAAFADARSVWRSSDAGTTWSEVPDARAPVNGLVLVPE